MAQIPANLPLSHNLRRFAEILGELADMVDVLRLCRHGEVAQSQSLSHSLAKCGSSCTHRCLLVKVGVYFAKQLLLVSKEALSSVFSGSIRSKFGGVDWVVPCARNKIDLHRAGQKTNLGGAKFVSGPSCAQLSSCC